MFGSWWENFQKISAPVPSFEITSSSVLLTLSFVIHTFPAVWSPLRVHFSANFEQDNLYDLRLLVSQCAQDVCKFITYLSKVWASKISNLVKRSQQKQTSFENSPGSGSWFLFRMFYNNLLLIGFLSENRYQHEWCSHHYQWGPFFFISDENMKNVFGIH